VPTPLAGFSYLSSEGTSCSPAVLVTTEFIPSVEVASSDHRINSGDLLMNLTAVPK
jgi:hypothetical protein